MTTARQSQGAMRLVRRYPRFGGAFLLVAGAAMTFQSFQSGKALARFAGGSPTSGSVVDIEDVGASRPDYQMSVTWVDPAGIQRSSTTGVFRYEAEHFKPGDAVELLVASDDSRDVMLKRIYDNEGLVSLGSAHATPLVFFGALLILGGLFLLATGSQFLGDAD